MADRDDVSQYPTESTGDVYYGDTDMDTVQIQDEELSEYATPDEMVHYISPDKMNDYLQAYGNKYRVRTRRVENRAYSRRILIPQMIDSGPGTIAGYSFRELTGAATATLTFHDGIDSNATIIFELNLAAGESTRDWFSIDGISYRYGLYVNISAGSISGNLFQVVPVHV
jgi:hypothetical protein